MKSSILRNAHFNMQRLSRSSRLAQPGIFQQKDIYNVRVLVTFIYQLNQILFEELFILFTSLNYWGGGAADGITSRKTSRSRDQN